MTEVAVAKISKVVTNGSDIQCSGTLLNSESNCTVEAEIYVTFEIVDNTIRRARIINKKDILT